MNITFKVGMLYTFPKHEALIYGTVRDVVLAWWDAARKDQIYLPPERLALPGSGPKRVAYWTKKLGSDSISYIPAGETFMVINIADSDLIQILSGTKVGWTRLKEYYEVKEIKSV